ncbi:ATP-binding protein [Actinomadura sp. 3N508]|uniref:ATP-binding protein n=1 Tax=Actinomadura sp. 3N508 TaxID=3375153 RepID=UPI0037B7CB2E
MTTTGTGTRRPATAAADRDEAAAASNGAPHRTGGAARPDHETAPMNAEDTTAGDSAGEGSRSAGGRARRAAGEDAAAFAAWDLAAEPAAASRARGLTRRALREWHVTDPGDVNDVVLIVDELVTNAVLHGAGPVRLALHLRGDRLDGEVRDAAPTGRTAGTGPLTGAAPAAPRVLDWAEAGRGLLLVAALATRYGTRPEPPGKTVWFTRHLTETAAPGRRPTT